jgi:carbamoyltransferase
MNILGLSTGAHDVGFSLLDDGEPIIHAELERYNRQKECSGDSLDFYFANEHLYKKPDMVCAFSMGWRGGIKTMYPKSFAKAISRGYDIKFVGHHVAHAANAFFSSNFDEALVLSIDGGGEEEDGSLNSGGVFLGKDNKINTLELFPLSNINIGVTWSSISKNLGYKGVGNQSGTVMAMAAFGEQRQDYMDICYSWMSSPVEGMIHSLMDRIITCEQDKFDLAASLQKVTENILFSILDSYVVKYPDISNICFAGGVSLNSSFTGKAVSKYPDKNFYIPPVPYDSGLSLGASQYVWHHLMGNERIKWDDCFSPYLGASYDIDESIKKEGTPAGLEDVVSLLEQDKIISVYGGRSESGRRALGNRSILASPLSPKMRGFVNEKVKHRQFFRPFAPSILDEHVKDYFEDYVFSPYMSFCLKFKDSKIEEVPAVVHQDGTGRLQSVTKKTNPWYHNLLSAWKETTGCPILLNTSFNDREPIVETPQHALNCFKKTDIDYLYFYEHNLLLKKS